MGSPAAVRVDNDLAARQAGVALGAANDEAARRVEMVNGLVVEELGGDDRLDDVLEELGADLLVGERGARGGAVHSLGVLGGNEERRHALGDRLAVHLLVLDRHLRLAVGAEPLEDALVARLREAGGELGREQVREGVELLSLVGGIAEHEALVTSTEILIGLAEVNALGDIRRLLLDGNEHVAGFVVKALRRVVESNGLHGIANNLLVVNNGRGGDLAENHNQTSLGGRLAGDLLSINNSKSSSPIRKNDLPNPSISSYQLIFLLPHLGIRVLSEASIKDRIRNNVAQLVCDRRRKSQISNNIRTNPRRQQREGRIAHPDAPQ